MTHSGGKPHAVGDKGQRYEVRATGWPSDGEGVICWTDSKVIAEKRAASILTAPGCTASRVIDRGTTREDLDRDTPMNYPRNGVGG